MIESPGFLLTVLAFALVIGPLIFIHEMGHYLAGRWFGVKAEAFSVGFGREVAGFTDKRGTRWKFGWMPLGGYVRFAGDMNPASQPSREWLALPPDERNQTFQAKKLWQRAIIVAAGPVTNFLLAILILGGFAVAYGESRTPPVVDSVVAEGPAAAAGFQPGDRIVAMGGTRIDTFDDIRSYTQIRPEEGVRVTYQRDGETRTAELVIATRQEVDRFGNEYRIGMVGIAGVAPVFEPVSLLRAPVVGVERTIGIVDMMVQTIAQIVTGRRPIDELGGPLRIAKVSGETMALGWPAFVTLIALVSINLGFINLLPIPMLDGGHLFFYAIEAVRRKPVDPRVLDWAFRGGLAALLALMLLVTVNDLGAFGLWDNLAGLIG